MVWIGKEYLTEQELEAEREKARLAMARLDKKIEESKEYFRAFQELTILFGWLQANRDIFIEEYNDRSNT